MKKVIREEIISILNEEGGDTPGVLEVNNINVNDAIDYVFRKYNVDIEDILPNFRRNFLFAKKMSNMGKTKRKDMPVISSKDVRHFQKSLERGFIDINAPYAPSTNIVKPFPDGLSGEQARYFLKNGLYDGEESDDKIKLSIKTIEVGKLKPIQKQIYFDKSITFITVRGVENSIKFFNNSTYFIGSSDNFIIDGHHRYLGAVLINPKIKVKLLAIDLPIKNLLPLSVAYSDAVGNKRNG